MNLRSSIFSLRKRVYSRMLKHLSFASAPKNTYKARNHYGVTYCPYSPRSSPRPLFHPPLKHQSLKITRTRDLTCGQRSMNLLEYLTKGPAWAGERTNPILRSSTFDTLNLRIPEICTKQLPFQTSLWPFLCHFLIRNFPVPCPSRKQVPAR